MFQDIKSFLTETNNDKIRLLHDKKLIATPHNSTYPQLLTHLHQKTKYLTELYLMARTCYDRYMASLEYELVLDDNKIHRKRKSNQPKYALEKDRKPDKRYNDLPETKEALPNHISKDLRDKLPTIKECVRVRRENADYDQIYRFGKCA